MKVRDFLLLVLICLVWGYSNVLSKIVVGTWGVPPLFFAAVRFLVVIAATVPWLLPMPRPRWRILVIGLLMGAGNFALLFIGLQSASPSAAAIVIQIGVPFTTFLSIVMLGERIHWRRGLGIALTLAGVLLVVWNPEGVALSAGLWFVVGAAFTGSLGAVLMKQVEDVAPLRFQAWVGLVSFLPLALATALFEQGQWSSAAAVGWPFVAAVLFAALVVSVVGHTSYYGLIRRYEANLLAPLTLMTPLFTIAFGVMLTGDRLDMRMVAGAMLALAGVLVVALRSRPQSPILAEREQA
ncbi:DMT family transporter [Sphingomonas dokdonensis]|uniref:Putative amino-acid metabolite efflux pump n=1 Tax=Sphingomonas dokdonensis TaxID=344880 RepID=A0A245ZJW6_9SPHN|nr:EamA family transporter [Sphingomonas dokdonensis]OWK30024.1 putative amino-acid metabolite efflux pump [Sphingomonas dokdonensis]